MPARRGREFSQPHPTRLPQVSSTWPPQHPEGRLVLNTDLMTLKTPFILATGILHPHMPWYIPPTKGQ